METSPGTRLRYLRELLGYKGQQQDFADKVGLTQQSISNMERDKTEPAAKSLNKIYAAFPQVNISWLVSGQGEPLASNRATDQLPPAVPSKLEPEPLRVNREGEEAPDYWQVIAQDRLREIEFLKELLRASNGIRPADDETAITAAGGKPRASSDAAGLYELVDEIHAETQRLVVAGFGTYRRLGLAS